MSLHLGKISPRVRRDELERVFRRFGHCSVQVKDKFGFVVYDYPVNAERALRTLRGKKICGELLTLSWSNNQPSSRGGNSYGRNCRNESYVNRNLPSYSRHDSRIGHKRPYLTNEPKDARNGNKENDKVHGMKEVLTDADGGPNENDRREEQIDDLQNGNEVKNGSEFERYEPCSGGDKRVDDYEMNLVVHQGSPPTAEDSQQRKGVVQAGKQNLDQTRLACYNCGKLGHKMRNCPEERGCKRKLDRFEHIHSDERNYNSKDEDGLRRMGSDPRGREQPGKEAVTIRSHKDTREASGNRKHRLYTKSDYSTVGDRIQVSPGKQYEKVKRIRESQSPEHRAKKSRRPQSSPIHSDDKVSRSRSSSIHSKSATRFASNSNFKSRSLSSSSTFSSRSQSPKSRNHRSKSGSRSRSGSLVSLYATTSSGCRSSTPPSLQNGKKDSLMMANSPEQNDIQIRSTQLVENGNAVVQSQVDKGMDSNHIQTSEEDTRLDEVKYPKEQNDVQVRSAQLVENGNAVVHSQVDKGMDTNHIQKSEEDTRLDEGTYPEEQNDVQVRSAQLVENGNAVVHSQVDKGMDANHIQKSEEDSQLDEGKYPKEQNDIQVRSAQLVENGNAVVHSQVDKGMDTNHIQKSEEDTRLDKGRYLSEPLLENDALNDEILAPSSQRETKDLQNCDLSVSEFDTPSHKTTRSMCLTSEEILMVIKHYGLKQPEEVDKDLRVESFFGCARLWPWEVIYYRRLKKGPISIENYARRIFQNKEFGIVDKYVRSSSGWGEEEY